MDEGDLNTDFSLKAIIQASTQNLQKTLTVADDGLEAGKIYSIMVKTQNVIGYSEFSDILRIALGDQPPMVTSLQANLEECGPTFVAMRWTKLDDSALSLGITGYIVEMLDLETDEWVQVLDASKNPD